MAQLAEVIRQGNPRAALRFLRACRKALEGLGDFPEIGVRYESASPEFADLRILPVAKFKNYLIFYRVTPEAIDIIRMLHGARDWQSLFGSE